MEMLMRCPVCHRAPAVKISDNQNVVIECEQHGHMAMGSSPEQAVSHWNTYIAFVTKDSADPGGRHMEALAEAAERLIDAKRAD